MMKIMTFRSSFMKETHFMNLSLIDFFFKFQSLHHLKFYIKSQWGKVHRKPDTFFCFLNFLKKYSSTFTLNEEGRISNPVEINVVTADSESSTDTQQQVNTNVMHF